MISGFGGDPIKKKTSKYIATSPHSQTNIILQKKGQSTSNSPPTKKTNMKSFLSENPRPQPQAPPSTFLLARSQAVETSTQRFSSAKLARELGL